MCGLWGSQTWVFSHPPGKDTDSPQPQGHTSKVTDPKVTDSKVMASRSQSQGHGLGERLSCLSVPPPAPLSWPDSQACSEGRPLSRRGAALGMGTTASPLGPETGAQMMVDAQTPGRGSP